MNYQTNFNQRTSPKKSPKSCGCNLKNKQVPQQLSYEDMLDLEDEEFNNPLKRGYIHNPYVEEEINNPLRRGYIQNPYLEEKLRRQEEEEFNNPLRRGYIHNPYL